MPSVCFYFHVHQPYRIKKYRVFDIGKDHDYFTSPEDSRLNNQEILKKVSTKCYLPTNKLLLQLLKKYPEFKISFSITGTIIEQFKQYGPEVLASFKKLVKTGRTEIVSETYYHSLAYLYDKDEFIEQIKLHQDLIKKEFGITPTIFRNTELIYDNDLAKIVKKLGFKGIITEGADHILGWRSPNFIYMAKGTKIPLLLKNYRLSDDIAFRFSDKNWSNYPMSAENFADWVTDFNGTADVINLFMDYETFGEHQWESSGIFDFLKSLPNELLKRRDNTFVTTSESVKKFKPISELDVSQLISWADIERDISAWRSNSMQEEALKKIYAIGKDIKKLKDKKLKSRFLDDWRKLQTSDHFYYMCTKWFNDGDVHKYFNPYESPYEAYIAFMNALKDLQLRVEE